VRKNASIIGGVEIRPYIMQEKIAKLFEHNDRSCRMEYFKNTHEVIKKLKIPTSNMNATDFHTLCGRVQQAILQYKDDQLKHFGRLLLVLKIGKGILVIYGYSIDPIKITSSLTRNKLRVEHGSTTYLKREHSPMPEKYLSKRQKKQVELETIGEEIMRRNT
jgi:hypothetical protein